MNNRDFPTGHETLIHATLSTDRQITLDRYSIAHVSPLNTAAKKARLRLTLLITMHVFPGERPLESLVADNSVESASAARKLSLDTSTVSIVGALDAIDCEQLVLDDPSIFFVGASGFLCELVGLLGGNGGGFGFTFEGVEAAAAASGFVAISLAFGLPPFDGGATCLSSPLQFTFVG